MSIENIQPPIIYQYFSKLNKSDFEGVAALFSDRGCLYPPFESGVCGRSAIQQYLQAEAFNIQAHPKVGIQQFNDEELGVYEILGHVQTNYFTVNVKWIIAVNAQQQIITVTINLLSDRQSLLDLKA